MEPTNVVDLPKLPPRAELMNPAASALSLASNLEIDDDLTYSYAASELQEMKGRIKMLEDKRISFTRPLDALKKQWMEFFGEPIKILTEAEGLYKNKMLTYKAEQDRKRMEEERKAREALEVERKKREAEAAEIARQAAEAESQAIIAKTAGDTQRAAELEAKAETAMLSAQEIMLEAQVMSVPSIEIAAPKIAGISTSYNYSATVDRPLDLIKAIAAGEESVGLIDIEALTKKVSALARLEKDNFRLPGCALVKTPTLSARKG